MVNIANKTINTFIENLEESDKKELKTLLSTDDEELKLKYDSIKETIITKLTKMKGDELDVSTNNTINETIDRVVSEKYDKLNYVKLKTLNENL
jgi:hypothetical protein